MNIPVIVTGGKLCQEVLDLHCDHDFKCLKDIFIVSKYVMSLFFTAFYYSIVWCSVSYVEFQYTCSFPPLFLILNA
jgi:hypothetical protein